MKPGLTERQLNIIRNVLFDHPFVDEAILFGSRSTGEYEKESDIDIALRGDMNEKQLSKVKQALREETLIPLFFDVIHYDQISNELFLEQINKKGISIFCKQHPKTNDDVNQNNSSQSEKKAPKG